MKYESISQAIKKFEELNEIDGFWNLLGDESESYFSKSPCGVCKTNREGTRSNVEFQTHGLKKGRFTLAVCDWCIACKANEAFNSLVEFAQLHPEMGEKE